MISLSQDEQNLGPDSDQVTHEETSIDAYWLDIGSTVSELPLSYENAVMQIQNATASGGGNLSPTQAYSEGGQALVLAGRIKAAASRCL